MSLGSKGEGKSGAKMGNSQSSLSLLTFALLTKLRLSALCCSIKYAVSFFFVHSPVGHFGYKDSFDCKTWPLKNEKLGCFCFVFNKEGMFLKQMFLNYMPVISKASEWYFSIKIGFLSENLLNSIYSNKS